MKTIILSDNLKNAIGGLSRITPTNALLPSLNGILLEANSDGVVFTATNLENTLKAEISGKTEDPGKVCIPGRLFNEICQTLPDGQITIEAAGNELKLSSQKFKTQIHTLPVTDFPTIPEPKADVVVRLSSESARSLLDKVLFAASTSETQVEIASVLIRSSDGEFVTVATDRYRLAKFSSKQKSSFDWPDVIIPFRAAQEAVRVLAQAKGEVELGVGEQQVWWKGEGFYLLGRTVDGQYPAFEQIILSEYSASVKVDKQAFLQAVKAIGVFVKTKGHVKLEYQDKTVVVTSENGDNGEGRYEVEAEIVGTPATVMFGHKYLLDGINAVSEKNVIIESDESVAAVSLSGEGNDSFRYVVMPIRS